MARRRLAPAAPTPANVPRAERPAHHAPGLPSAPIARVAAEAAGSAALQEMADTLKRARDTGRLVLDLPLDAIAPDHLARDRIGDRLPAEDEDMARPAREPARPRPAHADRGGGAHRRPALRPLSGWRRLAALTALLAETGEARFATVQALIRRPETAADAYVAMVEENEIRLGLSQYERARVAARAAERGVFADEEAALRALFASASRPKRSRIRAFVALYHGLDAALRFPAAIPERLGLALVERLREGRGPAIAAALAEAAPATAAAELALLERLARPAAGTVGRRAAPRRLAGGLALETRPGAGRLTLTLQGAAVDAALAARIEAAVAAALDAARDDPRRPAGAERRLNSAAERRLLALSQRNHRGIGSATSAATRAISASGPNGLPSSGRSRKPSGSPEGRSRWRRRRARRGRRAPRPARRPACRRGWRRAAPRRAARSSISRAAASRVPAGPTTIAPASASSVSISSATSGSSSTTSTRRPSSVAAGGGTRGPAAGAAAAAGGSAAGRSGSGRPISQTRPPARRGARAVPPLAARLRSISAKPKPGAGRRPGQRGAALLAPVEHQPPAAPARPRRCQPTATRPPGRRARRGGGRCRRARAAPAPSAPPPAARASPPAPSTATRASPGRRRRQLGAEDRREVGAGHLAGDQQVVRAGERLHPAAEAPRRRPRGSGCA